jgi:hypothetical protein
VSSDELIVQSFEWLLDYSRHYAEKPPRCTPQEPKPLPGKSLEHVGEARIPSSKRPSLWDEAIEQSLRPRPRHTFV